MQNRRKLINALLCLSLIVAVGCATMPMTQKQQVTIWQDVCVAEYENVDSVLKSKTSTEAQIAMAKKKKDLLIEIWPKLTVYSNLVNSGKTPTAADKKAIADLIDDLSVTAIGGH